MDYQRADYSILRDTLYGVGFHWTTATLPKEGEPLPYPEAVQRFDVDAFVRRVVEMGAGHVLFTTTHSKHQFPGPNAEIDRILPGRTCDRDLIMDLSEALNRAGILFMAYYNSGIHTGDPQWREAVGADKPDRGEFYENWARVIEWMGNHYGPRVAALWVDGGYELDQNKDTPWERLTGAAKAGHPGRLLCYNPGIEQHHLYTPLQDFWAGEVCRLNYMPRGQMTPSGLPWYAFVSWYGDSRRPLCGVWPYDSEARGLRWCPPPPQAAADFVRNFQEVGGAVTFNLLCYQDGGVFEPDYETMLGVKALLRG